MNYNASLLVVDDMEGMRRLLVNSLNRIGFSNIHTANHGGEAWRMLQEKRYDMVLSDWNMPVMSGLELLRKIRASDQLANTPVIMLTAEADQRQVSLAIEAMVSEYLVKPFSVAALNAKLQRAFATPRPLAMQRRAPVPVFARSRAAAAVSSQASVSKEAIGVVNTEQRATILVVDDVPDNLTILVEMLGQDYQVKAANSGARALKIVESGKVPDLILLDVMMPDMDGFEVCRRLKVNPASADVPVIFLTAMSEATDVTQGFALGAADYVTKPVEAPILKSRIETHLKLQRNIAELRQNRVALIEKNSVLEDNLRLREDVERMAQHDLRNPIAGIIGFASNLLADERLAQEHKDLVHYIEQSAYSVLNMVNLSLDLYKMELGSYEFQPSAFDLGQTLERIVRELQTEWEQRELRVERAALGVPVDTFPLTPALADESLCYSLFSNLLRNAAEAAQPGSPVQIAISVSDGLLVTVRNTGVVPAAIRDRFFDKYVTAGKPDGNGMGTYSARLMAITQGGSITMETSDSTGSTCLSVRLPTPPIDAAERLS